MDKKNAKEKKPRKAGYIKDSGFKTTESGEKKREGTTGKYVSRRTADPERTLRKYYAKSEEKPVKETKKITLEKPSTMLCPVPAVIVSCGRTGEDANMLTIAWAGTINSNPPMLSVSVQKKRFSHHLLERDRAFVVNIPTQEMVKKLDWVGVKSGKDTDKWNEMEFTELAAEDVPSPLIKECPINLECRVTQIIELPTHDMFLAEIVKVHVDDTLLDGKGQFHPEWAHLVCFSHGKYFGVPRTCLMKIGESVMRPKTEKRIANERKGKRREARRK